MTREKQLEDALRELLPFAEDELESLAQRAMKDPDTYADALEAAGEVVDQANRLVKQRGAAAKVIDDLIGLCDLIEDDAG